MLNMMARILKNRVGSTLPYWLLRFGQIQQYLSKDAFQNACLIFKSRTLHAFMEQGAVSWWLR